MDDYELTQQIQAIKDAIKVENEARARVQYEMSLLKLNHPEAAQYLEGQEFESEAAPEPQKAEATSVAALTEELRLTIKAQSSADEIRAKQAELQAALGQQS